MNIINQLKQHSLAQWVIVAMYSFAIMALYFEHLAGPAMLIFLGSMLWLGLQKGERKRLTSEQRNWLWVACIYALIMIASFFVHLPVTDDGVWRLSSYGFILLMVGMFYLQLKHQMTSIMLFSIILASFLYAITVFIIEWFYYGNQLFTSSWVRLGHYAAIDTGGYANFVMATLLVAIGVIAIQKNYTLKLLGFVAIVLLVVFAMLTKGRTNLFYLPFVLVLMVLFLWHNGFFKLKPLLTKGLVAISLIMIVTGGYLGKDRVAETVTDFQKMEQQDYYTSLGLRVMMYRVGLDIVKENPVMGVGLNQFKQEKAYVLQTQYQSVPEHVQEMIIGFTQIHNQFLMDAIFAGVFGIVGLLAFLGYPAWLYIQFYRKSPELSTRWIAFSGLLFIGYTLFTSLFGSVFTYTYTTILYMLINLMLIAYLTQSSADSEKGGG